MSSRGIFSTTLKDRGRNLRMLDGALISLPEGACALELGCGTVIDSYNLSKRHPIIRFPESISPGKASSYPGR